MMHYATVKWDRASIHLKKIKKQNLIKTPQKTPLRIFTSTWNTFGFV